MDNSLEHTTGHQNNRGHAIESVSIAFGVLESIAVALRFLAREKVGARYGLDDWLILVSLIPNYGMIIAGGFSKLNSLNPVWAILIEYYPVVSDGKAGNPKATLTHEQKVIFLKVNMEYFVISLDADPTADFLCFDDNVHNYCDTCATISTATPPPYI